MIVLITFFSFIAEKKYLEKETVEDCLLWLKV